MHAVANPTYDHQGKQPCDEGTRAEVLAEIIDWINDHSEESRGFLWLTGDPGAGKSAITASIARACKDDGTLWAQFFINRNNEETTNPKLYFPSIARQFIDHSGHSDVEIAVVEALRNRPSLMDSISNAQASHLFVNALKIACGSVPDKAVVVVIDGLDETDPSKLAETAHIFSQIFSSLSGGDSLNAKVLISSRTDDDIRKPFAKLMDPRHVKHIHLDTSAPSSIRDVSTYMAVRIGNFVEENDLNWLEWPGEVRMQAMCDRASGLFIWAVTVVKFFEDQIRVLGTECLNDLIDTFSAEGMGDINALYFTILQLAYRNCNDSWRFETFRRIVGCVAALKDPLSIAAIANLLQLRRDTSSSPVDMVNFFRQTRTIMVAGADAIDGETTPRLHKSFFEFISSEHADPRFRVDLRFSNGELAMQSIRLASLSNQLACTNTPELRYAMRFWSLHLSCSGRPTSGVCILGNSLLWPGRSKLEDLLRSLSLVKSSPVGIAVSSETGLEVKHHGRRLIRWCKNPQSFGTCSTNGKILAVTFSPDGRAVASCDGDHVIRIRDTRTGQIISTPHPKHRATLKANALAFSPDGKYLLSAGYFAVYAWDSQTGALWSSTRHHTDETYGLAISPDGARVASCGAEGKIRMYELSQRTCRPIMNQFTIVKYALRSITFSPDGETLLCRGDGPYRLWDSKTGKLIPSLPRSGATGISFAKILPAMDFDVTVMESFAVLFSPSGDLVTADGQFVYFQNPRNGTLTKKIRLFSPEIFTCAAISPNGGLMIMGGVSGSFNLLSRLNPETTNTMSTTMSVVSNRTGDEKSDIRAVTFSSNSHQTMSANSRGVVQMYDVPAQAIYDEIITSACISSNAILTTALDNLVQFWSPTTLTPMHTPLSGHTRDSVVVAISPDETRIAVVSVVNTVSLWNAHNRELICPPMTSRIQGFSSSLSLLFSSDSSQLTLGCIDGTYNTWSAHDGSLITDSAKNQHDSRMASEVEIFDIKVGWSRESAGNQESLYPSTQHLNSKRNPKSQSKSELNTQMQWISSHEPNRGLWAYVDDKLIRSNGTGSVTIIDVPGFFNND